MFHTFSTYYQHRVHLLEFLINAEKSIYAYLIRSYKQNIIRRIDVLRRVESPSIRVYQQLPTTLYITSYNEDFIVIEI